MILISILNCSGGTLTRNLVIYMRHGTARVVAVGQREQRWQLMEVSMTCARPSVHDVYMMCTCMFVSQLTRIDHINGSHVVGLESG